MTGRLQLEASTSGCTHSCWTPNRPSHFGSRQQQRHQTFHHHWPNRVPQDPARVVHCRAVAPDVDTEQDDWASRLLSVTSKRRKSKQGSSTGSRNRQQAPNEGIQIQLSPSDFDGWVDNGDDDDHKEEGSGMLMSGEKRLPASVRCFDSARIYVKSGDGGAGCVSFRREPYVEKGGPNGGNGGRGGHVWAIADPALNSLMTFRHQMHFRAANGTPGQGSQRDGADATDLYVKVPLGTIIRTKDAGEDEPPLAELLEAGQKALLLVGGRGGRGNASFKTGRNTAPAIAEKGEVGREAYVDLELKVVADVGIVGVPNAGKSTLLGAVTAARPKIANYPFTTLVPNLGVCEFDFRTTVFADVPGLLEGAHEGHGLGHHFLRHVQRCRALVHVIDGSSPDPIGDFKAINLELELFNPELTDKPQVVAYNKTDLPDSGDYWEFVQEYLVEEEGVDPAHIFPISAVTGRGVTDLVRAVRKVVDELGPAAIAMETDALNRTELPRRLTDIRMDDFSIEHDPAISLPGGRKVYIVQGQAIERFTQMTNWNYYEAVKRFQRILEVSGINEALRKAGIQEGDTVVLGEESEFVWSDEKSESALYGAWLEDMQARGRVRAGKSRWPGK
eukprot:jgi/Chrzof1/1677/Cz10g16250.t1